MCPEPVLYPAKNLKHTWRGKGNPFIASDYLQSALGPRGAHGMLREGWQ